MNLIWINVSDIKNFIENVFLCDKFIFKFFGSASLFYIILLFAVGHASGWQPFDLKKILECKYKSTSLHPEGVNVFEIWNEQTTDNMLSSQNVSEINLHRNWEEHVIIHTNGKIDFKISFAK